MAIGTKLCNSALSGRAYTCNLESGSMGISALADPPVEIQKRGDAPAPPAADEERKLDPRDQWILELLRDNARRLKEPANGDANAAGNVRGDGGRLFRRDAGRFATLEDLFGAGGINPTERRLADMMTLTSQRAAAEAKLTPDQKRQLDELRIGMSQATTYAEREQFRKKIDAIDPALGSINARMRETLLAANAENIATTTSSSRSRPELLLPMRMSTIQCHRPADTSRQAADLRALEAANRKKELDTWKSLDDSWYAPYTETCTEARRRGLTVEFERKGDATTSTPRFFYGNEAEKKYLPIDAAQPLSAQVDRIVEEKLKAMESTYNVSFFRANQPVMKPTYDDGSGRFLRGQVELRGRQPSLQELAGIESALEASKCSLTGDRVKIGFLSERATTSYRPAGQYWSDMKGVPTIMMFADADMEKRARYRNDDHYVQSNARNVMLHEIAHHNQHRWNLYGDTHLIEEMGWKRSEGPSREWMLRGKNGEFYKVAPAETGTSRSWVLVNSKGEPVDAAGKPVEAGKETKIPQWELRDKLLVKPTSTYFDNPAEMHAEAMMNFRSGGSHRADMLSNMHLYHTIKRFDQLEIDDYYKRNFPDKRGIRLPDGRIADRTPENVQAVTEFETVMAKKPEISDKVMKARSALSSIKTDAVWYETLPADHAKKYEQLLKTLDEIAPDLEVLRNQKEMLKKWGKENTTETQTYNYDEAAQVQAQAYATYASYLFAQRQPEKAKEYLQKALSCEPLKSLDLAYSSMRPEDIAHFAQFTSLQELTFARAHLTPDVAASIAKFSKLETLNVQNTQLSDAALETLSKLPKISALRLSCATGITDGAFEHVAKMKHLQELRIDGTGTALSADILKPISSLPKLSSLDITGLRDCDAGLAHLRGNASIARLDLNFGSTPIKPGSLAVLKSLPQLKWMSIYGQLVGDNIKDLSGLAELESLSLYSPVTGFNEGMSAIKSMPKLKYLQVYADIDDGGIKQLEGARTLEYLHVHSKDLKADGLQVLATIPNLTSVTISNSQFGAESLNAIRECKKLTHLNISTTAAIDAAKIEAFKQRLAGCKVEVRSNPPAPAAAK